MLLTTGKLHETARQGVITLLAKKDKNLNYLTNWRPLTLLNVDYKILSTAVSLRIKSKADYLIHEDQLGFMQGRNISHTLRKTIDIIQIAKKQSLKMVVVSMDWEKCFDKISFNAIDNSLEYFNFGPRFRQIVQILLSNSESCVLNNGHMSLPFQVLSGVKQGSNASPLLLIWLVRYYLYRLDKTLISKGSS